MEMKNYQEDYLYALEILCTRGKESISEVLHKAFEYGWDEAIKLN